MIPISCALFSTRSNSAASAPSRTSWAPSSFWRRTHPRWLPERASSSTAAGQLTDRSPQCSHSQDCPCRPQLPGDNIMSREPFRPRSAYRHWTPVLTRWFDNDVFGHVNKTIYYGWLDTAVCGWLMERSEQHTSELQS